MLVRVSGLLLVFCMFLLVIASLNVLRAAGFVRNFDGIILAI